MAMLRGLMLLFLIFSMGNAQVHLDENCPFGWKNFGVRCYKYFSQSADWITAEDGQWLWSDGSVFDFTYWCTNEPNNNGGPENCLELTYTSNRCWNDLSCSYKTGYICAKDL